MPITATTTPGGTAYTPPLVNGPLATTNLKIDVSTLTNAEVDSQGNLKPGTLFQADGTMVSGAGQKAFAICHEVTKIMSTNVGLATNTNDVIVGLCTHGLVNRDIAEDNLGRDYTAFELASFGDGLKVTPT